MAPSPDALSALRAAFTKGLTPTFASVNARVQSGEEPRDESDVTVVDRLAAASHVVLAPSSSSSGSHKPLYLRKDAPTRFSTSDGATASAPTAAAGGVFDVQTLVFCFLHRDAQAAGYMRAVSAEGAAAPPATVPVGTVPITDRRIVIDWLTSKLPEDHERVLASLPDPSSDAAAAASSIAAGDVSTASAEHKQEDANAATTTTADALKTSAPDESAMDVDGAASAAPAPAPASAAASSSTPATTGSAAAAAAGAGAAGAGAVAAKRKYVADKDDLEKVRRIVQRVEGPAYAEGKGERMSAILLNRESAMRLDRFINFESARHLLSNRLKAAKSGSGSSSGPAATASSAASATPSSGGGKPGKKKNQTPIIIISPSSTSPITMYNVKKFLEAGEYQTMDEARLELNGGGAGAGGTTGGSNKFTQPEDMQVITHWRTVGAGNDKRSMRFHVIDSIETLARLGAGDLDEAWNRVVCVLTTGQDWQFREYKWQSAKELFHHVKGFYVHLAQEPANPKVRAWNVSELKIDPIRRHVAKSTSAELWRQLDLWILQRKPHLLK